jgi:septal ring factor EnvC (AmiA/AmiB activator)
MDRVMGQVKSSKKTIETEQQLVVGIRNAIENECEDRNEKKGEMNNDIEEKKAELDALRKEYESLNSVLQSQESEIKKVSI